MSIDYSDMAFPKPKKKEKESKFKRQKKPKIRKKECKQPWKKTGMKKIPSIMQDKDDRRCYLCMLLEKDYRIHSYLEEHHVLFGDMHKLSDWYGLRVNLCMKHHREGTEAVHNNYENAELLRKIAQQTFEKEFPELEWMEIIKVNYLEER